MRTWLIAALIVGSVAAVALHNVDAESVAKPDTTAVHRSERADGITEYGNVYVNGRIRSATGYVNDTLTVDGGVTARYLTTLNDATLGKDLSVARNITAAGGMTLDGGFVVNQSIVAQGTITGNGVAAGSGSLTALSADISGKLECDSFTDSGALDISGAATFNGATTFNNTLYVAGGGAARVAVASVSSTGRVTLYNQSAYNSVILDGATDSDAIGLYVQPLAGGAPVRVVGRRGDALTDVTDGTTDNLMSAVNAINARLRAHGLVAP